jgi:HSP20 family protein
MEAGRGFYNLVARGLPLRSTAHQHALETFAHQPHIRCHTRAMRRFASNRRAIMTIVSYEPWALVGRLQRHFERAQGESADSATVSWIPHVDIHEEDQRFVVAADLPGVERKDIDITADKGVLTLKGERRSEKKSAKDGYERVERATGTFLRRFTLPESADAEAIQATLVNGVLEVSIPKRPQEQPRRISVAAA